jgi:hypothetical protein
MNHHIELQAKVKLFGFPNIMLFAYFISFVLSLSSPLLLACLPGCQDLGIEVAYRLLVHHILDEISQ